MAEIRVSLVGAMYTASAQYVQMIGSANVDLSNLDADCVVPCAVVAPRVGTSGDQVLGFVVRAKARQLIRYCQSGLGAFMTSQFLAPMSYPDTGTYDCIMATDMVAVAQYLDQPGSETATVWPLDKRAFVLLLVSSPAFQLDCAVALAGELEARGVTVLLPAGDTGTFVPVLPPESCTVQHEHYDDPPQAPPPVLEPSGYDIVAGAEGGDSAATKSQKPASWLPWTLVGLAMFGVVLVAYEDVKARKEERP